MSGPVWRFEAESSGNCSVCLRSVRGLFVEGEVADSALTPARTVCAACLERFNELVVGGEQGAHGISPAYARPA